MERGTPRLLVYEDFNRILIGRREFQKDWIGKYGSTSGSKSIWEHSEHGSGFLNNVTKDVFSMLEIRGYVDESRVSYSSIQFFNMFFLLA